MKKYDKKYFHWGLTLFLVLSALILLYYVIFNSQNFADVKSAVIRVLLPVIDGLVIAYILSPMQNVLEQKVIGPLLQKKKKPFRKQKRIVRIICTTLTILIFVAILFIVILLIVPQVLDSLEIIISRIPRYMDRMDGMITDLLKQYPDISELTVIYWPQIEDWLMTKILPTTSSMISSFSSGLVGGVVNFVRSLLHFIIGIILSIYLLFNKELFCAQAKKIIYAFLKEEKANNLINNVRFANRTFGGFISGKIIDSIMIGVICFIGMTILKIPYSLLISVIVGVTNVIPYFGPFLGAIPSVLILLMVSPMKALIFLIWVLILQQFDGNVLGPKILGQSTGLSGFWVIFSITVFGGFFGVFGMFIGVPLFAVIYAAIRTAVNERLIKKELPSDTLYYETSDYHSDEDEANKGNSGLEFKYAKKAFSHLISEQKKKKKDAE